MLILFAGSDYYPDGGGLDFIAVVESVSVARSRVEHGPLPARSSDHLGVWAHVLDTDTGEVVAEWHTLDLALGGFSGWVDGSRGDPPPYQSP